MSTLFVGLGRMGAPMARRYAPGRDLVLLDAVPDVAAALAEELGARALGGPGELPDDVDTAILMLPNSRIVEDVLRGGLLEALPAGALVIDMSSSEPASTVALAGEARARGIGYVDAPVSGGVAKAETGELSVMVGGDTADVERALPHLEPVSAAIVRVGPSGAGHAAKALNNLASASNIAVAAEVVSAATRFGIEPAVMVDVLNTSTGRSQASEVKFPRHILTGRYDSAFLLDLMVKDLTIARGLIESLGVTAPVTETAFAVAREAAELPHDAPLDHTELARLYEERNGLSFSATEPRDPEEGTE